jgi:hypothetical protein
MLGYDRGNNQHLRTTPDTCVVPQSSQDGSTSATAGRQRQLVSARTPQKAARACGCLKVRAFVFVDAAYMQGNCKRVVIDCRSVHTACTNRNQNNHVLYGNYVCHGGRKHVSLTSSVVKHSDNGSGGSPPACYAASSSTMAPTTARPSPCACGSTAHASTSTPMRPLMLFCSSCAADRREGGERGGDERESCINRWRGVGGLRRDQLAVAACMAAAVSSVSMRMHFRGSLQARQGSGPAWAAVACDNQRIRYSTRLG